MAPIPKLVHHWDDQRVNSKKELEHVEEAARFILERASSPSAPSLGIICGSGLSKLSDAMSEDSIVIPYLEIPYFPQATVPGHANSLVVGDLNGVRTVCLQGRFHFYEGHSLVSTVFPIRVLSRLGVKTLLVTNSAGAIDPSYSVGDIMVIEDHISFLGMAGMSPLRGENLADFGPRFPSLTHAYHGRSYEIVWEAAKAANIPPQCIHKGVYVNVGGPVYETPAEVKFFRMIGGDAVGMSTVPEVTAAVHCGMKVVAFSLLTNIAVHDRNRGVAPNHQEVLEASQSRAKDLEKLVFRLAPSLHLLE